MPQIWIRRDRETGELTEMTEKQVRHYLGGVYANLEYALQNCDKSAPLSNGWADYWPKEENKEEKKGA